MPSGHGKEGHPFLLVELQKGTPYPKKKKEKGTTGQRKGSRLHRISWASLRGPHVDRTQEGLGTAPLALQLTDVQPRSKATVPHYGLQDQRKAATLPPTSMEVQNCSFCRGLCTSMLAGGRVSFWIWKGDPVIQNMVVTFLWAPFEGKRIPIGNHTCRTPPGDKPVLEMTTRTASS